MRGMLKKHWRKIVVTAVSTPVVVFLALCLIIGGSVRNAVSNAQASYPGDPVTSLIAVMTSDDANIDERNRSIWALGQLGSSEALPALQSLVVDEKCDHESKICQYELEKAIKACSGSYNLGAVVWRHGGLAVADNSCDKSP